MVYNSFPKIFTMYVNSTGRSYSCIVRCGLYIKRNYKKTSKKGKKKKSFKQECIPHLNPADQLDLGDLLQFLFDGDLSGALHVERLVYDGLCEQLAHVFLVLHTSHHLTVRGLRDDLAILGDLRAKGK